MEWLGAIDECRDAPTADGLLTLDKTLRIARCTEQAALLLHRSRSSVIGRRISEILAVEFVNFDPNAPMVRRIKTDTNDLLVMYEPLPYPDVAGVVLLRNAIQEGELAREINELQDDLQNFRGAVDEPPVEVFIANNQGVVLHVSNTEETYGLPESAFIGKSVQELQKEGLFYPSVTELALRSAKAVTVVQQTRAGRHYMTTAHPIFDDRGEIYLVVSISREITGFYNLKQQLAELDQWIQQYVIALEKVSGHQSLIVESDVMRKLVETLGRIAAFDSTVLFLGESGTGKDTLARLLHSLSSRNLGPFVKVNCGAIPETLMESEFFGYMPGAFTGAQKSGKKGLVEMAEHGTLFLDEVDSLPLHLQAKLLHVLQEREFIPVGGTSSVQADVRFLAATNKDLEALVREGSFREDLYYRLHVVPVLIPPLRERREEILSLANFFLQQLSERYGVERQLDHTAIETLLRYRWPGNVRELENVIERCVVTTCGTVITADCLAECLQGQVLQSRPKSERSEGKPAASDTKLDTAVADMEKEMLAEALKKYGSTRKVAAHLGVNQSTVVRKMKRFGLNAPN